MISGDAQRESMAELADQCRKHALGSNAHGWTNPHPLDDPRSLLLEYQHRWAADKSRFKAALQARQSGKDFAGQHEIVLDCLTHAKTEWMVAAPSERQSLESLEKAKQWAEAFDLAINDYSEVRDGGIQALLKSASITFSTGSRITAVPGKPETVRGPSANIALTECDFFEKPIETWRAILPSITNPLRGGTKKVRVWSTPNGQNGLMHRIFTGQDGKKMVWSKHRVTIYDAVLQGLPVDIDELREAFGDPDGWGQEFECEFMDTASVLLPYELIALCESIEATETVPQEFWATRGQFMRVMGIDFGRSKDLTAAWTDEVVGDISIAREVLCLRNTPTPEQVNILGPRIARCARVCLDYAGPGIGLGDYLVREHGEYDPDRHLFGKIELVKGTNENKVSNFSKLRMVFERRGTRIPISNAIREDLHSVYRCSTPTGQVTYRAPHNEDGHADRATAKALAERARSYSGQAGKFYVFDKTRRSLASFGRRTREVVG